MEGKFSHHLTQETTHNSAIRLTTSASSGTGLFNTLASTDRSFAESPGSRVVNNVWVGRYFLSRGLFITSQLELTSSSLIGAATNSDKFFILVSPPTRLLVE